MKENQDMACVLDNLVSSVQMSNRFTGTLSPRKKLKFIQRIYSDEFCDETILQILSTLSNI